MIEPVRKTIEVPCDQATAFKTFVEQASSWWPLDKHSISAMNGHAAKSVTIEPRPGGKILEVANDDAIHEWGSVSTYEPFDKLSLNWHVNAPPHQATFVDIVFTRLEAERTRVDLTHHNWEVLGDRAAETREGYNRGWVGVFETAYANALNKKAA